MSKIWYVWLYLFTGLLDFLQVWRACKGKAAALHKVSMQPAEQRREEASPCRPQSHKAAPTPCPDLPFLPLQQGRAVPCAQQGAASQSRGSWQQPAPAMGDQRAQGDLVSLLRCRVLCLRCCLQLPDTHAGLSCLSSDSSFMRWAEHSWKMCGLGFALRLI